MSIEKHKEDIYFFEVNTKYISSNALKISVISRLHSTSEMADIFNTWDEIFLVFTNKRAKRPWFAHLSIQTKSQTFNFEIWVTFDQGQRMTLTFDAHSTSLTHLVKCFKQLWDLRLQ